MRLRVGTVRSGGGAKLARVGVTSAALAIRSRAPGVGQTCEKGTSGSACRGGLLLWPLVEIETGEVFEMTVEFDLFFQVFHLGH